jgi:multimeric flavodoxin WrbA
MKILAILGSPRPNKSNTGIILQEFLKGASSQGANVETIYLKEKNINFCIGCNTCWMETPGVCIFKDDMPELLDKVIECDILVYATPLYNYNMTSLLKSFQERLHPLIDPHLVKTGETYRHPQRYEKDRKMVLISTCGLPEVSHFEGLRQIFRQIERSSQMPLIGELLVPTAELLKKERLQEKIELILQAAYRAGIEVVLEGKASKKVEDQIQKSPLTPDGMAEMANKWWDTHIKIVDR